MTIPKGLENILNIDLEVMHGALCFAGTRVPIMILLDNLAEGMSVSEFVEEYPSVTRKQVLAVVDWQQKEMRQTPI